MNELQIVLEALQFLLGQHTNDVDPVKADTASRHLLNVKGVAEKALAPVATTVAKVAAPAAAKETVEDAAAKLAAAAEGVAKPPAAPAPAAPAGSQASK
jgi:hypothetical protein